MVAALQLMSILGMSVSPVLGGRCLCFFLAKKTVMTGYFFGLVSLDVLLVFQIYCFLAHLLNKKKTSPGVMPSGGRTFRGPGRLDGQRLGLAFHLLNALLDMGLHGHRGFHEARRGLTKVRCCGFGVWV